MYWAECLLGLASARARHPQRQPKKTTGIYPNCIWIRNKVCIFGRTVPYILKRTMSITFGVMVVCGDTITLYCCLTFNSLSGWNWLTNEPSCCHDKAVYSARTLYVCVCVSLGMIDTFNCRAVRLTTLVSIPEVRHVLINPRIWHPPTFCPPASKTIFGCT